MRWQDVIHSRQRRRQLAGSGCIAIACVVGGCNVVGAVLYKFSPPPTIKAVYTLKNVPTVILVENYRDPDLSANESELLARYLEGKLTNKKLVTVIPETTVLNLKNERPKDYSQMTIPEIGREVGAEQVLYVDLQSSAVGTMAANAMYQGKGSAYVKIVDCKTGDTLWPTDNAEGYGVNYQTPQIKGAESGTYNSVRDQLFDGFADTIAKLFYTYNVDDNEPHMKTD